jgi:hypothetical protein
MITPDASEVRPTYNEAGLLEKVEARARGAATWTPFVDDIDYDAKGQREKIVYAGGATRTEYEYDDKTFRLKHLVTTRALGNKRIQDLSYTYDPVGNITEIVDAAQQEVFFDGDEIEPKMAYVYDALYRLTSATGREHASTGAYVQPDENDAPIKSLPHANDVQALRTYTESYEYDAVGNILRMIHDSGAPETSWTRRFEAALFSMQAANPLFYVAVGLGRVAEGVANSNSRDAGQGVGQLVGMAAIARGLKGGGRQGRHSNLVEPMEYEAHTRIVLRGTNQKIPIPGDTPVEIDVVTQTHLWQVKRVTMVEKWPSDRLPGRLVRQLQRTEAAARLSGKRVGFATHTPLPSKYVQMMKNLIPGIEVRVIPAP